MSAEARPITSADFSRAIEDLPLENIYSKASEIANSIAHLERSNHQLQEYSDSIRNDTSLDSTTRSEGDKDCLEAIRENEIVITRQRDRMDLLRAEVERRGGRWHEGDFGSSSSINGSSSSTAAEAPGGRLTDEQLRQQMQDRLGQEDDQDGMHL